jgi:hypothetical protein
MQTYDPSELTVRFVGGPPSEEVLRWAQQCAARITLPFPLTLVLRWKADKASAQEVRLESAGKVLVSETEPDLLIAVSNAFARASALTVPAHKPS